MTPRTIVLSLTLIMGIFTYYGYSIAEKIEKDFKQSSAHFNTVTYVLSPLFDACSISVVDTQVKLAHGQTDFKTFCKVMISTRKNLQIYLENYNQQKTDREKDYYVELAEKLHKVDLYLDKAIKACENNDRKTIYQMLNSGEMYSVIDPTTKLINKILDDKLEFAEISKEDTLKILDKFRQFLLIQLTLCLVVASAVLVPKKKKSRYKKSIIT